MGFARAQPIQRARIAAGTSVTIKSIAGIDHAVIAVKDLDAAAQNWKQLGFTISPRGTHSAHMGTGNYTIMLGEDYMELLGVLAAPSTTRRRGPISTEPAAASSASPSRR